MVTEGDSNIVISVPGDDGEQARELGATAQLRFRPVLRAPEPAGPAPTEQRPPRRDERPATPTDGATPTDLSGRHGRGDPAGRADRRGHADRRRRRRRGSAAAPEPGSPPVTEEEATAQFATLTCEAENVTGEVSRPDDYVADLQRGRHGQVPARPHDHRGHRDRRRVRGHQPGDRRVDRPARLQVERPGDVGGVHRRERRQERRLHPGRPGHLRADHQRRDQRRRPTITGDFTQEERDRAGQPAPVRRPPAHLHPGHRAVDLDRARRGAARGRSHRRRHRDRAGLRLRAVLLPAARPGHDRQPRALGGGRLRLPGAAGPGDRLHPQPGRHRRVHRLDRHHRRLVRRLLRTAQGRDPRGPHPALGGAARLGAGAADDPLRRRGQLPGRADPLPAGDRRREGLRLHPRHVDGARPRRRLPLHPPPDGRPRAVQVVRQQPHLRPRPGAAHPPSPRGAETGGRELVGAGSAAGSQDRSTS